MNIEEFKNYKCDCPLYAVIGSPIEHSISPMLHTFIYENEKIDARYIAVKVESDELDLFTQIARKKLYGFNVTIPHKNSIINYLDEIDETAANMGSVNTVKVINGKLKGYNTDVLGVEATFKKNNIDLSGKKVLVLGDGGASRAVINALSGKNCSVRVAHRPKPECYVDTMSFKGEIRSVSYTENFSDINIVINTTPVGMQGFENETPLLKIPQNAEFVFDVIYTPLLTKLLNTARAKSVAVENGLYMLLTQGIRADEIWFDREISEKTSVLTYKMMSADVVKKRLNGIYHKNSIVLSGFMGCGKSTIGKRLAKELGFAFYDTDEEIEKQCGLKTSEIFAKFGEPYFRKLESKTIQKLSDSGNAVISTGGGAMVDCENFKLCKNSLVLYLDVKEYTLWCRLKNDTTRPLLQSENPRARLDELLNKRKPFYEQNCDIKINAVGTVPRVVRVIYESI